MKVKLSLILGMMKSFLLSSGVVFLFFSCHQQSQPIDPQRLAHMMAVRRRLEKELGERYDRPVVAASDSQLQRGQKLFAQLCAGCHGPRGDGKGHVAEGIAGYPSNFTDPAEAAFYSPQARLQIIRKGVPGTPMMGWENVLTEEDILAVYVYVRSLMVSEK